MTILVTAASRYGSTLEIAEAIGRGLAAKGADVEVKPLGEVTDLAKFDAVVLGAAVYAGKWVEEASSFVDAHAEELAGKPTWLFSSGPVGDPPKPVADKAVEIDALVEKTGARGHRLFAGKIDRANLSLAERAVMRVVRAREGDYRDWAAIDEWAMEIAEALQREGAPA